MKFLELKQRLDELRLRYKSPTQTNNYDVIAHRGNVWIVDDNDPKYGEVIDDIESRTGANAEDELEERPDIIHAYYNPAENTLWMSREQALGHHPRASSELKKLVQFLGVDAVEGDRMMGYKDVGVRYSKYDMEGQVPNELYHGTGTDALNGILRFGLVPERGEGNWPEVGQFDAIYLAADWHKAAFHATRQQDTGRGAPVILKVKIPDRAKIVPDFDAMMALGPEPTEWDDEDPMSSALTSQADELGYTGSGSYQHAGNVRQRQQITDYNPGAANLPYISGVVGYRGRIPANHILRIDADLRGEMGDAEDPEFHSFQIPQELDELQRALEIYSDYGYWYYGIEDELAELEDEDEFEESVMENDWEHADAYHDTGFWGRQGAGVLFQARDTGRILFAHRSPDVLEPNTWGTWGGAIDSGESPAQAAARECVEEAGFRPNPQDIIPMYIFEHESGFRYHNFLALVDTEFQPHMDWETQNFAWVDFGNWPTPLHPGTAELLQDQRSLAVMRQNATRNRR